MQRTLTYPDYLRVLEKWPRFANSYWWDDPRRPDIGCFGTGYNSWGVQTNQKALAAYAVLAAETDLDETAAGCGRDELLDRALRMMRYSIASHLSGDHHCSDGTSWGHTWISLLGVERMMHGIQAIDEHLTDRDREGLRRMLVSEADAVLQLDVTATKWAAEHGNRPESNIWNGAFLWRAARTYPDAARADEWVEKAHRFLLNGISVAADAADETQVAGRPLKDRHVGPNFFDNYALDHHGYLNVGYMVICLSNIAMLHFACRTQDWEPPESLYHHAGDLWRLVKHLIFADGRLARVGGDTRQRYCYCQDYLLPALLWAADYLHDAQALHLEAGALDLIRREQQHNADGSFLSERLDTIRSTNPYYYTRLESDKAVVLSMNAYWRRKLSIQPAAANEAFDAPAEGSWHEPEHGALLHRSERRLASWSWRAAEPPQGLCLPPTSGHLAEWCANIGGSVTMLGDPGTRRVTRHHQQPLPGGFVTVGTMEEGVDAYLAEGWRPAETIAHHYAVAALPDDRTMVIMQYCRVRARTYISTVKGLKLNVPNDLFNDYRRTYVTDVGPRVIRGDAALTVDLGCRWVNVSETIGAVGIYGAETFTLHQAGRRRAAGYGESLFYDELCFPCRIDARDVDPASLVLDCASAVLSAAGSSETGDLAAGGVARLHCAADAVRAVRVAGADGDRYILAAGFSNRELTADIQVDIAASACRDLVSGYRHDLSSGRLRLSLTPGAACLLRLEGV